MTLREIFSSILVLAFCGRGGGGVPFTFRPFLGLLKVAVGSREQAGRRMCEQLQSQAALAYRGDAG